MNRKSIQLETALELMSESIEELEPVSVDILKAQGHVLAEDVIAKIAQPPFPRSPLDGYAFRAEDSSGASRETPVNLSVVDKIFAGEYSDISLKKGEAVRLMTGAPIPKGADCVIRQEDTNEDETSVEIYRSLNAFDNYCFKGEDYNEGIVLLQKGTYLDCAAIGVLASNGTENVKVTRKPSVAVVTTGDELVKPEEKLGEGKIYNSNMYILLARLNQLGYECTAKHIADEAQVVADEMKNLLQSYDMVITTGGVSVGQKDILNEALPLMGANTLYHGLALKPGSPAKYSVYGGKPILSLSGNPFAAAVTFELLGQPLLNTLCGMKDEGYKIQKAILMSDFGKASKNRRFIRGFYKDGKVTLPSGHSSGQLRSMVGCNCLVDIKAGSEALSVGDEVTTILL